MLDPLKGKDLFRSTSHSHLFRATQHPLDEADAWPCGADGQALQRKFDETCLTPVRPLSAGEIRALREREGASQAVFTRYLNVTPGLISQWERGEKHPQGASLKLLALVARNGLLTVA
jgi:putative transcriptional regulator